MRHTGIVIRAAAPSERTALEALQLRASLGNAGDRDNLLAHPDAIEVPDQQLAAGRAFVAECDGALAGFAALEPRPDGDFDLDGLFVDPPMQRRGIGRALVEYCCGFARDSGSRNLHVIGNPHAMEFYLACAFERIGERETRFGPGILMMRRL